MNEETVKLIEQLAGLVGHNSALIVEQYTYWHMVAAISWILVGVFFCIAAVKCPRPEEWDTIPTHVVRCVFFVAGLLMLAANIPDVFAPEAFAIHQLIIDIKR